MRSEQNRQKRFFTAFSHSMSTLVGRRRPTINKRSKYIVCLKMMNIKDKTKAWKGHMKSWGLDENFTKSSLGRPDQEDDFW